jgi:hypothetical protein
LAPLNRFTVLGSEVWHNGEAWRRHRRRDSRALTVIDDG